VKDDRLWILARRGLAPSGLHLVCLAADSGQFLWNRLICANSARVPEGANLASSLRIVRHESTLLISTELGCIAALNEEDGQPIWYRTYPRQMETNGAKTSPELSPACVVHEGVVYAAPHDSDQLLALDLLTGATIWSQTRPADHRVWGVAQDRVITSGKTLEARHVADGQLEWRFSAPIAELRGRGRGLVTNEQIWWPTPTQILVFHARNGHMIRRIDLRTSRQLQGGNLAANGKGLVISSPDRVTVLSPWGRGPARESE
jgi:outer membrane protein assembly factor BamB